jgi:hypothetical protein
MIGSKGSKTASPSIDGSLTHIAAAKHPANLWKLGTRTGVRVMVLFIETDQGFISTNYIVRVVFEASDRTYSIYFQSGDRVMRGVASEKAYNGLISNLNKQLSA